MRRAVAVVQRNEKAREGGVDCAVWVVDVLKRKMKEDTRRRRNETTIRKRGRHNEGRDKDAEGATARKVRPLNEKIKASIKMYVFLSNKHSQLNIVPPRSRGRN